MHRRRALRGAVLVVSAVVLVASTVGPAVTASPTAAETDPVVGTSIPLTPRPVTATTGLGELSSSADYVAFAYDQLDLASDEQPLRVHRRSDGSFVRHLPRGALDGDSLVQVTRQGMSGSSQVVHEVATGAVSWEVSVPGLRVASGAEWVLFVERYDAVRLARRGQATVLLPFEAGDAPVARHVDPVTGTAVLSSDTGSWWHVDLATGDAEPGRAAPTVSTPTRLFHRDPHDAAAWTWTSRDGVEGGEFRLDQTLAAPLAWGDGIAALDVGEGGSGTLRPVDLDSGELGEPVADRVSQAWPTADGHLLVVTRDGQPALSLISPDGPTQALFPLFALHRSILGRSGEEMSSITVDDGVVLGRWSTDPSPDNHSRFEDLAASLDGTQEWSSTMPAGLTLPTSYDDRERQAVVQATATAYVERLTAPRFTDPWPYRVVTSDGSRESTGSPRIGRGDRLLRRTVQDAAGNPRVVIEDLATGQQLFETEWGRGVALDGTWVWSETAAHEVVGLDTATGRTRQVAIPSTCDLVDEDGVRAGWALLYCTHDVRVIDLTGEAPPWVLPRSTRHVLGHGFVAWVTWSTGSSGHPLGTLWVGDLNGEREPRSFGLAGINLGADRADNQTLVFSDRHGLLRRADLGWLQPVPDPVDTVRPVLTATRLDAAVLSTPTGTATHRVSGRDDSGTVSYETAYRRAPAGASYGAWTTPAAWRGDVPVVSRRLLAGETVCFRARVLDLAGNASAWSPPRCATAPFDDRHLVAGGKVARITTSVAMSRTETRLLASGARLSTRTSQRVARVQVIGLCGPGQGAVRVYVGTRLLGTVNLACTRTAVVRRTVGTTTLRAGIVVLRSTSSRPARIDGIAVLR